MTDVLDTIPAAVEGLPPELENIRTTTKRGFDPKERMRNRGLRRGTITIYLDEELGPELGWAVDIQNALGDVIGRNREGAVGDLEAAEQEKAEAITQHAVQKALDPKTKALNVKAFDQRIAELTAKRDELVVKMNGKALIFKMRAVPPVIQKDCRRKAKLTLNIETKRVPEEMTEEFDEAHSAHLMVMLFESVTDTESGETNTETTYEDAIEYIRYLPPGQFDRLDAKIGTVQFTDAISRQIEGQEDFS